MTQVSIQTGQNAVNTSAYRKHRVILMRENELTNFVAKTGFLLDGKVRSVRRGINEQIDTAEIEFPSKVFGNLINFVTPILIAVDNATNVVFRGFLSGDTGILSRSEDIITAQALGFRWILNKTSKLRGRIFTVDNNEEPPEIGDFLTDSNLFEKFRLPLPTSAQAIGYLGSERCIFNANGIGDCATDGKNNKWALAFKVPPSRAYTAGAGTPTNLTFRWSFATILRYIERYYILPFVQSYFTGTKLRISQQSYQRIFEWGDIIGEVNIQPNNFDIDGIGPMEAIERLVKVIPGPWYWRIRHARGLSEIDLINDLNRDDAPKAMFIGTGGKILDDDGRVNVAGADINRNIQNAVSHAIGLGNRIKVETTLEYIPKWIRYIRPTSDQSVLGPSIDDDDFSEWDGKPVASGRYLSNFKNPRDYQKWLHTIITGQSAQKWNITHIVNVITAADLRRYEEIFRDFQIPGDSKEVIRNFEDLTLDPAISPQYGGYTGNISGFIFQNLENVRTIEPPLTKYDTKIKFKDGVEQNLIPSKPFVFLYDEGREEPRTTTNTNVATQDDQDKAKAEARFIIPKSQKDKDVFNGTFSFDNNFRVIRFSKPQFSNTYEGFLKKDLAKNFKSFASASTRRVFVTCRIGMDVPTIADKLDDFRTALYGGGRFVSYNFTRKAEVTIRSNALYPVPHDLTDGVPETTYIVPEGDNLTGQLKVPTDIGSLSKDFPLVDYNLIDKDGNLQAIGSSNKIIKNDFGVLTQIVEDIMSSTPEIEKAMSVDHGRLDLSYEIGDIVDRLFGSELPSGADGYYDLDVIITSITITARGGTDAWRTSSGLKNRAGFVLGDTKPRTSP